MRKMFIATLAAATLLGATAANADYYNRNRGGHHHHGGGYRGGWVAPLIGGMVLSGALYGLSQTPSYAAPPVIVEPQPYYREPVCRDVFLGYDSWNRPRYRIDCY